MDKRNLGRVDDDIEALCMVLHPRNRPCTTAVCRNGGDALRYKVDEALKKVLTKFTGTIDGDGAGHEKQPPPPQTGLVPSSFQGDDSQPPAPAPRRLLTRLERMRAMQDGDISAAYPEEITNPNLREERALQEMADYMADRTVLTNRDLLQYWKGKHARWPHLSLIARLYAGVDSTSCQAERNFSILNCTLDNLRTGLAVDKVEHN